jgi:hypothetical protein
MGFATGSKHVKKAMNHAWEMHSHLASAKVLKGHGEHHAAAHHEAMAQEHEKLANKHFGLAEKHGYHKSFSEEAMRKGPGKDGERPHSAFHEHVAEARYAKGKE